LAPYFQPPTIIAKRHESSFYSALAEAWQIIICADDWNPSCCSGSAVIDQADYAVLGAGDDELDDHLGVATRTHDNDRLGIAHERTGPS
jgi:hypothetical protein